MAVQDLRSWITRLEDEGHLCRVKKRVHWDQEIGGIARRTYDVMGDASPSLLFENIADYQPPGPNKLFIGQFRSYSRIAMMLGLPHAGVTRGQIIKAFRRSIREPVPYTSVRGGSVKENILEGEEIDVFKFPVPVWHKRDRGRYLGTMHGVITKDPETGWVNVGLYRVTARNGKELGIYIDPGRQHIGLHFSKYIQRNEPMPVAIAIGVEPSISFVASGGFPVGVCEYDIAGGITGAPVNTLKGETVDLPVPAEAEIVVEGFIDPKERKMEGPFGEYPGYYGEVPRPAPVIHVTCITHRNDPIYQGSIEGHPVNESHVMAAIAKTATAWEAMEQNGVMGVRDVAVLPETASAHIVVSIKPSTLGHADWIASVLWGLSNAIWHFKHVIVVDEDIDPWDAGQVNWSIAWRVKAGEDIKIWKDHRGSPIDPRQEPERKGLWDRVLIDATRPYHWEPRSVWGSDGVDKGVPQKYPPTTHPGEDLVRLVNENWDSYGIRPTKTYIGSSTGMMKHWWEDEK